MSVRGWVGIFTHLRKVSSGPVLMPGSWYTYGYYGATAQGRKHHKNCERALTSIRNMDWDKKYITVDFSWFWHMKDPPNLPDPSTKPNSQDPLDHTSYLLILGHHHILKKKKIWLIFGPPRPHLRFHGGLPKESLRCDEPLPSNLLKKKMAINKCLA